MDICPLIPGDQQYNALIVNNLIKILTRWGNRRKVILGSIIGYFLGKFSYANTCADKFLVEAPNSKIADMIRMRRGMTPRNNVDTSSEYPDQLQHSPPQQHYDQPQQQQQQQLSGYDEMRRRNREAAAPPGFTPQYQSQLPFSLSYQFRFSFSLSPQSQLPFCLSSQS